MSITNYDCDLDRREIDESRAHASEIMKRGLSKWSDLDLNEPLMSDWNSLINTKSLIYSRKRPLLETHADAVETYLTQQNWDKARIFKLLT